MLSTRSSILLTLVFFIGFNAFAQEADFTFAICGRAQSITPWTDIKKMNLVTGEAEVFYEEGAKEYQLNTLDRGIPEVVLDAITPMGLGVASCAYDAKRNRLYYSCMEHADLRYFNLNKEEPSFTIVQTNIIPSPSLANARTQFSRMAMADDGYGYALSNDAKHFFRFTTDRKPVIEMLGSIENAMVSMDTLKNIHWNQGGDMVCVENGKLLLVSAMRTLFAIDIETKKAKYIGRINNLPEGFTINGICLLNQEKLIVSSALSLSGWYIVDLNNLSASPFLTKATEFTSSDLDNGLLLSQASLAKLLKQEENKEQQKGGAVIRKQEPSSTVNTEQNVLGFYPSLKQRKELSLLFSKDELGIFDILVTDVKANVLAQRRANIDEQSLSTDIQLKSPLKKGLYYVKATHLSSGHIYLKKLEVE